MKKCILSLCSAVALLALTGCFGAKSASVMNSSWGIRQILIL